MLHTRFVTVILGVLLAACGTTQPPSTSGSADAYLSSKSTSTDFLKRFDRLASRMYTLCDTMSEAQLNWRPAAGVRSMLEALGHLNATQYRLSAFAGTPIPSDIAPKAIEALSTKASVLDALRRSNTHARAVLVGLTNRDMERRANVWGKPATVRFPALLIVAHQAEHLGQAIAYGRKQGVVPPWSK